MPEMEWTWSPWLQGSVEAAPVLRDSIDVDVAVVGGGYTGLSTAIALREVGLTVAVLEAKTSGFGASGRNAGRVTPTIGKDPPSLVRLYGKLGAKELLDFADLAVREAERLIRKYSIDCDYRRQGTVFAALHPSQFGAVEKAARTAEELDLSGELLDEAALESHGVPRICRLGYLEPTGGQMNPAKYCRGLRRVALEAGAEIFDRSPVVRLDPGRAVTLWTPEGEVRARFTVVATNAYTPRFLTEGFDSPVPSVARIVVQKYWTEPLDDEDLARIRWTGANGIFTAHEVLEGYQITTHRRLAGGTKIIRYGYDNADLPDVEPSVTERLVRSFRERFPELDHTDITDHWGGSTAFTFSFLPQVGRAGPHHNVLYSIGYAGHGLAQASYAGTMIRDLLFERDGPGRVVWQRSPRSMPPEPFRFMGARALMKLFEAMDGRTDRRIREAGK